MKKLLKKLPGALRGRDIWRRFSHAVQYSDQAFYEYVAPGHFYSPLPDAGWVRSHAKQIFDQSPTSFPGINLNVERQLEVLAEMGALHEGLDFSETRKDGSRFYYQNPNFGYGDVAILHGMMRRLNPSHIVEVGSGFSSAAMLDIADNHLLDLEFTFVEPYATLLKSLLSDSDRQRVSIIEQPVQHVGPEVFSKLGENDILFIDSSHVLKTGSDLHHLLLHVVPTLAPGVVIHFHDVFWPFEYPETWVMNGRAWNEIYALHAFLLFNKAFEIEYFNHYIGVHHRQALQERMPICLKNPGGGLWLKRV